MIKIVAKRALAVSVVAAALVGGSVTSAFAAGTNGSDADVYLYDAGTGEIQPEGLVNEFSYDVIGVSSATDVMGRFQCSPDATSVQTFISPIGSERNRTAWTAYADSSFIPDTANEIQQFPMTVSSNSLGSPMSVQAKGGAYSLGLACLIDNNVNFAKSGLWYSTIDVVPVTGDWTARAVGGAAPEVPTTPVDPTLTGEVTLNAETIDAEEGVLSLSVPAAATATIGSPAIVDGLSTSTGVLGQVTVADGRFTTLAGWTLTTKVADFVNMDDATNTIPAAQLGIAPKVVSSSTAGVVVAAAKAAGSSTVATPFAEAPAGSAVASTVLDADLTFVAPAAKVAGTYTSKLTLTLTSK